MNNNNAFRSKVALMLDMQVSINEQINKEWKKENNKWYRAIWTECAEMMDHVGWKWWKKQEVDLFQLHLELVDIWHFGISHLLNSYENTRDILDTIEEYYSERTTFDTTDDEKIRSAIEKFSLSTLKSEGFSISEYFSLMSISNLDFDTLFQRYIGKNTLNKFRQDNGYKDGSYIKIWEGYEDNVWLERFLSSLDLSDAECNKKLYSMLDDKYKRIIGGAA